jgi:hypothetical protein
MDSDDITREQARQIHGSLFKLANYLHRLRRRMEQTGFRPADPLFQSVENAHDAVCKLLSRLHYLSCDSGVGRSAEKATKERIHGRTDKGEP